MLDMDCVLHNMNMMPRTPKTHGMTKLVLFQQTNSVQRLCVWNMNGYSLQLVVVVIAGDAALYSATRVSNRPPALSPNVDPLMPLPYGVAISPATL
jgi:hypothetical protein